MKKITQRMISESVASLVQEANFKLRPDVLRLLKNALLKETNPRAKGILRQIVENASDAGELNVALCQDTGLPVVFAEIGRDVNPVGLDIAQAIQRGVEDGYRSGSLRNSIVLNPLQRRPPFKYGPCVIHFDFSRQKGLRLTVLPKGFGCENKTRLAMFNPTASLQKIKEFIISVVQEAGPDACPPYILGIGIGGTSDHAALLSKKALLQKVFVPSKKFPGLLGRLAWDIYRESNSLNIGPMGLGGKTTVLGVNILDYPTHIAGLPVCVNISCHALRSASALLR